MGLLPSTLEINKGRAGRDLGMRARKKNRRHRSRKLIRAYAEKLPGTVLGVSWKEFHGLLGGHSGIYVLYKNGVPHYVGKVPISLGGFAIIKRTG